VIELSIKRISLYFKSRKELYSKIYQMIMMNRNKLKPGRYRLRYISGKKVGYFNNKQTKSFLSRIDDTSFRDENLIKYYSKSILRELLDYIFVRDMKVPINKLNISSNYEIIMISRKNGIKLFDLYNRIVLNLLGKTQFKQLYENYILFHKYFNMTYIDFDFDNFIVKERLIEFESYRTWRNSTMFQLIDHIFILYLNYIQVASQTDPRIETTKKIIESFNNKIKSKQLQSLISEYIPIKKYNDTWIQLKSHGDFAINNILFTGEDFFFIDWEDADEYLFFYDIFNLLFTEYIYDRDKDLLINFFAGRYDKYLKKLFVFNNTKFNQELKMYYLILFICQRIVKFEIGKKNHCIDYVTIKYLSIMKSIINKFET